MPGLTLVDIDHKEVTGLLKKSPKINSKKCKFPKKTCKWYTIASFIN